MSEPICYLNGDYQPLDEACVPVLDRGFIFGDGVYEVIPVYAGKPFRLDHHLERLNDSLNNIYLANPLSDEQWTRIIQQVIMHNAEGDQSIYLQVTRGVAKRDHGFPGETRPTVFVMSNPFSAVDTKLLEEGVGAITLEDIRWQYCHIKSIALLPNILLRQQALNAGAAEAILLKADKVTEGAASNVFAVLDGKLVTPPKGECLLPGITRDLVVELADKHDIACEQRDISREELLHAAEIWITSSTREILPVTHLDGHPVGDGLPGPLWQKMYAIYQDHKNELRQAT
ncbi:D-amino acid aminotransferase [Thiohalophilus thiocyanatoxydans]|uniref:Aminodeoxychorismate lyase n=1 Tax=Thiohalophilus thiocyanatoxydans TaxID=381308 RepID=A0A4R8ITF2_9GAMM|nr:D-amino acid aminotransferase [Thiohalophilus thiocyanatoxydans]TDY04332.1 D-alanine transaminase [Thiohalophilus thiocyanatoxydans]